MLWDAGYSVGIIAQPDWKKDDDLRRLGRPRLFFGITSGNVDSMVNNLTPNLKRRSSDVYSPGGALRRPDRAAIVYTDRVHSLFPGVPIILGGIEASLRRFAHYDYWSDAVRRSILADAPADLLIYGMGERPLREVALRLENGERIEEIRDVAGTAVKEEVARWRKLGEERFEHWPTAFPACRALPRTAWYCASGGMALDVRAPPRADRSFMASALAVWAWTAARRACSKPLALTVRPILGLARSASRCLRISTSRLPIWSTISSLIVTVRSVMKIAAIYA